MSSNSHSAEARVARENLPQTYRDFVTRFPEVVNATDQVAEAIQAAGPLDRMTSELIKLGIALGAGLETAVESHARRALEQGATREQLEQAILLGITTCGFPRTVAAWQWALRALDRV
jgi:4-carboxymuconolactone decarboxylase